MAIPLRSSRPLLLAGSVALCVGTAFAGDVHRAIVSRTAPAYPELARRMHVGGKVVLLVSIKADGTVSGTKVESGHALLAPSAQDAVTHWRFAPNSDATESEVEVNFNIDGQ
ncbi:energy transducer TonB [Tunturibacter psychrotolerans]|uniref:Energy transducer TonB n=1 Tax=Tunturiibacter psychrotolerans TaxID=3069686 RepID=A0AAU7ZM09_9BACT